MSDVTQAIVEGTDVTVIVADNADISIVIADTEVPAVVVENSDQSVVLEDTEIQIVDLVDRTVITVEDTDTHVISIGEVGPPGAQGIPGPAGAVVLSYVAGVALSGHRMVVLDSASEAIYADGGTISHANKVLGMTTGAANMGTYASIQTSGPIVEPTWNWTLDIPVWLGLNGLLTQTPPTSIFSLIIGFPIDPTQIFIDLREPIFLI